MNVSPPLRLPRRALLAAVLAAGSMHRAIAATATSTFQVTANVATQCTVSAADLNFGTVDPLGGNVDQTIGVLAGLRVQLRNGLTAPRRTRPRQQRPQASYEHRRPSDADPSFMPRGRARPMENY